MKYDSFSAEDTRKIGYDLGQKAKSGDVICLDGDLGVGKTVFTQGFAQGLGIEGYVTSPTFTIINEYHEGRLPLYHFDVYRISSPDEMEDTGYEEYFYGDGVCLIEWANMIEEMIPGYALWVSIQKDLEKGENYRRITMRLREHSHPQETSWFSRTLFSGTKEKE